MVFTVFGRFRNRFGVCFSTLQARPKNLHLGVSVLKDLKKIWYLIAVFVFVAAGFSVNTSAQDRERLVKTTSSRPVNQPAMPPSTDRPVSTSASSRPTNRPPLVQDIQVARPVEESKVTKIVSSRAIGAGSIIASRSIF